jgi:hypothetical protein
LPNLVSRDDYRFGVGVSAFIALVGVFVILASAAPRDPHSAAALFPPWWSSARAFAAAGSVGEIARTGVISSIIVVHSNAPGLADRLRDAGALLIIDPERLVSCGSPAAEGALGD